MFMASKNYADAADYYYRALKQSSFQGSSYAVEQAGDCFSAGEQIPQSPAQPTGQGHSRRPQEFADGWNNLGTVYLPGEEDTENPWSITSGRSS
jgi:hypothetical protein